MIDPGERCLSEVFELFYIGPTFPKPEIIGIHNAERDKIVPGRSLIIMENRIGLKILYWGVPFSERFIIDIFIFYCGFVVSVDSRMKKVGGSLQGQGKK